jgi:hypothetical protein
VRKKPKKPEGCCADDDGACRSYWARTAHAPCSVLLSCGGRPLRSPARTVVGVGSALSPVTRIVGVMTQHAGLEIHSEEERTSVRTTTLRWFSRGREDGGGAEETDGHGWKTDCDSTLGVRIQRRVGPE